MPSINAYDLLRSQDILAEMVHTKDGSRVVREFLAQGNAKVSRSATVYPSFFTYFVTGSKTNTKSGKTTHRTYVSG